MSGATMDTLRYVDVEVVETGMFEPQYDGDHGELTGYEVSADLPEPFRALLAKINDHPDEFTCGMAKMSVGVNDPDPFCTRPVGWVLHEDDDYPHRSGLGWVWTTLVETSEGVLAVCEECSPGGFYAAAMYEFNRPRRG